MKISEKEIIDLVSKKINFREEVLVPVGEDAGVIFPKQDSNLVVTTDTMVLNTHFSADITPYELGYISAASNISDLSAMGALPAFATVNLTIEEPTKYYIDNLINGYNDLFKEFPVTVLGGDTTYGHTSLTMTLIGYSNSNNFMKTSDAKSGDKVFISGAVGNSLLAKRNKLYNMPELRNKLGILLPDYANSCTDMSDGLLKSINLITKKSNLGAKIKIDDIAVDNKVRDLLGEGVIGWEDILSYGEDYELLFTVNENNSLILKNICDSINLNIYEIGFLNDTKKITFHSDRKIINIDTAKKFEHFNNDK